MYLKAILKNGLIVTVTGSLEQVNGWIMSTWREVDKFRDVILDEGTTCLTIKMRGGSSQFCIVEESLDSVCEVLNLALEYNGWFELSYEGSRL